MIPSVERVICDKSQIFIPSTLTLSTYCDQTCLRNASYSPFFLIVWSSPSIVDRCAELRGSSEILNLFRETRGYSSNRRLLSLLRIEAIIVFGLFNELRFCGLQQPPICTVIYVSIRLPSNGMLVLF